MPESFDKSSENRPKWQNVALSDYAVDLINAWKLFTSKQIGHEPVQLKRLIQKLLVFVKATNKAQDLYDSEITTKNISYMFFNLAQT